VRQIESIYRLLDRPFPGAEIVAGVSTASLGLGAGIEFSPAVAAHCDEMLGRLCAAHEEAVACA
jgi:hypothetical protein